MPTFHFRSLAFSLVLAATGSVAFGQVQSAPIFQRPLFPRPLTPITSGPTSSEAGVINEATAVLHEVAMGSATNIPENLLASAEGVAIIPHYVRGAFVIGIGGGRGVLLTKDANQQWQAPEFITIGGGSIGWQAGVEAVDLVLVFRSPRSLNNIRQRKVTLGVNASAAAGPIGRYASAATDLTAQAEIFTYSRSRGLFAGVSLTGASLQIDIPATQAYYQTAGGGPGLVPATAIGLVEELKRFSRSVPTVALPSRDPSVGGVPPIDTSTGQPSDPAALQSPAQDTMITVPDTGLAPLERSVSALLANVDTQWQAYLALPAHWRNARELASSEVQATWMRYERVATNPRFEALRSLPEFKESLEFLRQLASETSKDYRLQLPPPPATDAVDVSRGRY